MQNYPLTLSFKLLAVAPQIKVTDATNQTVLYVRQKLLALKEDIKVYADEAQQQQVFQVNADRIIDFSANYRITTPEGLPVGTVRRQGMKSLWKASYPIVDANGESVGRIHEENPWVKVLDGLLGEIPGVGFVATLLINPSYLVDLRGQPVLRLRKRPAIFEGRFTLEKLADFSDQEERLLLSSLLMMLLLERGRG